MYRIVLAIKFLYSLVLICSVVPDFRSGMDTKLETGPGVWELRAHNQARGTSYRTTSTMKAIPSPTHMLFVKMQQVRETVHVCCMHILLKCIGGTFKMCSQSKY